MITVWLDAGCAISALAAALFWLASAAGKLPPQVAYWDETPETDPYRQAIKFSVLMNRWAAGFSAVSAFCLAASTYLKM